MRWYLKVTRPSRTWRHWLLTLLLLPIVADNILWISGVPLCFDPSIFYPQNEVLAEYEMRHVEAIEDVGLHHDEENPHVLIRQWPNFFRASRALPLIKKASLRVLVLGCSVTNGYGVTDQETFVWRLNELMPEIEFVNAGVGGYGALRSLYRLYVDIPKQLYDLVIYVCLHDHCARDTRVCNYVDNKPDLRFGSCRNTHKVVNTYCTLYTSLDKGFHFTNQFQRRIRLPGDEISPLCASISRALTVLSAVAHESNLYAQKCTFSRQISALATTSHAFGCPFVLMSPTGFEYNGSYWHLLSPAYPAEDISFDGIFDPKYRVNGNPNNHPNSQAHQIIAERIADYLNRHRDLLTHRSTCAHRTLYDLLEKKP